jgi:hypothetical protein
MATNSKVFVSPGVYTSEVDLSFVAQSVGVTTLGIVGETVKGPAFEPIFVRNYDEFQTYFGGTTPEKFINTQIPKYEAAYIAKAYLQQSNQLFVTRVLGLSGYDAGPSWSIMTKANVDPDTIGRYCVDPVIVDCLPECNEFEKIGYTFNFTACTNSTGQATFDLGNIDPLILEKLNLPFEQFNGSTSSINNYLNDLIYGVIGSVDQGLAEATTISYFGSIDTVDYDILSPVFTGDTNVYGVPDVSLDGNDLGSSFNDPWFYSQFDNTGNGEYSGFSFFSYITGLTNVTPVTTTTTIVPTTTTTTVNPCVTPIPTTTTTTVQPVIVECYTGSLIGVIYTYTGTSYTEYDDLVIATLRSRGLATYTSSNNPVYEVSNINNVTLNLSGVYSGATKNPYLPFVINVTNDNGTNFTFETSFSVSDSNYVSKVFGTDNFGKPRGVVPVFLEERFQSLLNFGFRKGYIRGINSELVSLDSAQSETLDSIGWYLDRYQSANSPWVVSELRGTKVFNLFKFYTISDGDAANTQVKISIINISFNNLTFDILVRDYYDTDSNPVVLEKFTNCTMNPNENSFVAKKVGTLDGEYELNSKYIMV